MLNGFDQDMAHDPCMSCDSDKCLVAVDVSSWSQMNVLTNRMRLLVVFVSLWGGRCIQAIIAHADKHSSCMCKCRTSHSCRVWIAYVTSGLALCEKSRIHWATSLKDMERGRTWKEDPKCSLKICVRLCDTIWIQNCVKYAFRCIATVWVNVWVSVSAFA